MCALCFCDEENIISLHMTTCCASFVSSMMLLALAASVFVYLWKFVTISASEDGIVFGTFSCTLKECTLDPGSDFQSLFKDQSVTVDTSTFLSLAMCNHNVNLTQNFPQFAGFPTVNALDVLLPSLYSIMGCTFVSMLFAVALLSRANCCGGATLPLAYLFSSIFSMLAAGAACVSSLALWSIVLCLREFAAVPFVTVQREVSVYILPCLVSVCFLCSLITLFSWCCCPVRPKEGVVVVGLELGDVINAAMY